MVVWDKERTSNKLRNKQSQVTLSLNCRVMWLNQKIYLSRPSLFAQYKYMFSAISVQLTNFQGFLFLPFKLNLFGQRISYA